MPDPDSGRVTDTENNISPFKKLMPAELAPVSHTSISEEKNNVTGEQFISDETTEHTLMEFASPLPREKTETIDESGSERTILEHDSSSSEVHDVDSAENNLMQQVEEFLEKEAPDVLARVTRVYNMDGLVYDVDDLYQNAAVRLLKRVQQGLFTNTNIRGYFRASIHNEFLDLVRRDKIYQRRFHPLTATQTSRLAKSRYLGPEKSMMLKESMEYALDVVSRANEVDKIIINGILDDVTYEELGKQVGLSKNGVKSRMFRFHQRVKQAQRELDEVV